MKRLALWLPVLLVATLILVPGWPMPEASRGAPDDGSVGDEMADGAGDVAECPPGQAGPIDAAAGPLQGTVPAAAASSGRAAPASFRDYAESYQQNCRDFGVPVPGPLASDPGWSAPVTLDAEAAGYFFEPQDTIAKVWTYRGQNGGFCIAFLRQDPSGLAPLPLIGTICSDRQQRNACFFDNFVYGADNVPVRLTEAQMRVTDFKELVHPLDLQDKCNACHIGQNPYIVHPHSLLGRTITAMYEPGYTGRQPPFAFVPFGGALKTWQNPKMLAFAGTGDGEDGACMRCHNLPEAPKSANYCSGILELAARRTMPADFSQADGTPKPILWPDENGCFPEAAERFRAYFTSARRLKAMCTGRPVKTCGPA